MQKNNPGGANNGNGNNNDSAPAAKKTKTPRLTPYRVKPKAWKAAVAEKNGASDKVKQKQKHVPDITLFKEEISEKPKTVRKPRTAAVNPAAVTGHSAAHSAGKTTVPAPDGTNSTPVSQRGGARPGAGRPPQRRRLPEVTHPKITIPKINDLLPIPEISSALTKTTEDREKSRKKLKLPKSAKPVRICALGGLGEIGKNLYVYECGDDLFIVDCGLAFPDEDAPGVDIIIPEFTYLEKNRERFLGIILTHGHEDHIGGLAFLLKKVNAPVYGTRLTLGLVEGKLREHNILNDCRLNVVEPGQTVKLGCMAAEFIRVNHSIPDACAIAVHTPAGVIVHTGDFKIDYTPIEGGVIDLARFAELGHEGVLALLSDSTNAERTGSAMSESKVGESFRNIFSNAAGKRIIVATFASNIHRVQQIIDIATATGRKVAVSGRSMVNVVQKAIELNYIRIPAGTLVEIESVNKYPPDKIVIVTTGSQGEPLSALTRMSTKEHRQVSISPLDLIILSATPIPGNEKTVSRVVNDLMKLGAEVYYEAIYDVHVSGHACQDELKMMLSLTRPKFFLPVHGEYKHQKKHALLAAKMGIPEKNIFILGLGQQVETDSVSMKVIGTVPCGRVLVDGLGVGDVGAVVLRDRKKLAEDGLLVVVASVDKASGEILSGPDIVSRGFVYVRESDELMTGTKDLMRDILEKNLQKSGKDFSAIKNDMRDELSDYLFIKTKRSPMILPVLMEV